MSATGNTLPWFDEDDLAGLAKLATLDLSGTRITGMSPLTFGKRAGPKTVRPDSSLLATICSGLFAEARSLEAIALRNNAVATGAFAGSMRLRTVDRRENRIRQSEAGLFHDLARRVRMGGNPAVNNHGMNALHGVLFGAWNIVCVVA